MQELKGKTVVSFTVSNNVVTLYFDDGKSLGIPANTKFAKTVLDAITPAINAGNHITLSLETQEINIYHELEKKSKGLVKFFRVAKKALGLGGESPTQVHIESIALPMEGYRYDDQRETIVAIVYDEPEEQQLVEQSEPEAMSQPETETAEAPMATVAEQTDAHQTGANVPSNPSAEQGGTSTQAKPAGKVITGADRLAGQVKHFSEQKNPEGFLRFMQRLSTVVEKRRHSVDELLDFLSKADLPIANDGCIVAYKRLCVFEGEIMVDSHSRKVKQRVGSHVFMAENLVDHDRTRECSNGLHIGRRDYMGSFSGDTIIICKIAPEDVITVPRDYGGSKMRCCGYHIVHRLNDAAFNLACSNQSPLKNEATAAIMTAILNGNHVPVIEKVEITGHKGNGLVIHSVEGEVTQVEQRSDAVAAEIVHPSKKDNLINPAINSPKAVKERMKAAEPEAKATKPASLEMTKHQELAQKRWPEVKAGTLSKTKLAQECRTSTRSLDRWAEKFKF